MPAATSIALGVTAAAGVGKAISGGIAAKNAKNQIDNYQRQNLDKANAYENLKLRTSGTEFAKEENARLAASALDIVRAGGLRGVFGALPKVVQQGVTQNRRQQLDYDNQERERDLLFAGDEVALRRMKEQREYQDLAGLSAMYNTGRQDMWNGIGDITSAGMSAFGGTDALFAGGGKGGVTPMVFDAQTYKPQGLMPLEIYGPSAPLLKRKI